MTIKKIPFDYEQELQDWVEEHPESFFGPSCIFVPGDFFVSTRHGKKGKPDGFSINLQTKSWAILEVELLKHGVWDHIAEQVMRFIVAARNPESRKRIRNRFFARVQETDLVTRSALDLGIPESELLLAIENVLENQDPSVVIVIDEVNDDLEEFIEAINCVARVFTVDKFDVNGVIEYHTPNNLRPTIATTPEEVSDQKGNKLLAVETLGGGQREGGYRQSHFFRLKSNDLLVTKYSKVYENTTEEDPGCWYGITPNVFEQWKSRDVTHVGLIMGTLGVTKVPIDVMGHYLAQSFTTDHADGSTSHHHVYLWGGPPRLGNKKSDTTFLLDQESFFPFDDK
jgi:hypothetical protein